MDNTARYFAVFGNPVAHSKSPLLYNAMFRYSGYPGHYTRIMAQTAGEVAGIIREYGLSGANITTPFKEDVVPGLDELSREATILSAVNTVLNIEGHLIGHNTDGAGVTGALEEAGTDPAGKKCIVFGAGGAGKAAALALTGAGADVFIANRSYDKARSFGEKAGCHYLTLDDASGLAADFDVIVLTLPPGVYPFDPYSLKSKVTVLDANYRSETAVQSGRNLRCRLIRGERWLLHQAIEAYRLFTGRMPDKEIMEKGLMSGEAVQVPGQEPLGKNFRELVLRGTAGMFFLKKNRDE